MVAELRARIAAGARGAHLGKEVAAIGGDRRQRKRKWIGWRRFD